ncbi:MAG: hypothetical protein JFR24_01420 [Muribaculaceae bacterium]|jgi:hypothetical protein|nr:hypothetical protein [Muribaculaceae bacterium]MCI9117412.1 hypothetical protein [Muribaculaceae bacterium]
MPTKRRVFKRLCGIAAPAIAVAWVAAQIAAIYYACGLTPDSDSAYYLGLAQECVAARQAYPLPHHLASHPYIANPGYINLTAGVMAVCGNAHSGLWLNLIMNCSLLFVLYVLCKRLCGTQTARIFAVIFCLIPSNTFIVQGYMSELPCELAAYAALLCATGRSRRALAAAGALIVAANYIRPVAAIFALPIILCLSIKRAPWRSWGAFAGAAAAAAVILGAANFAISGRMFLFSSTAGVNAIMGANDTADGAYRSDVFTPGREGHIPDSLGYDVFRKDSLWKNRAMEWALGHPSDFIALIPRKVYVQMFSDSYHTGFFRETSAGAITADGRMSAPHKRLVVLESLPYYAVLLGAAFGMAFLLGTRRRRHLAMLLLVPIAGNLTMAVATVGGPRYHYPVIPVFCLLAAIALNQWLNVRPAPRP